MIGQDLKKLLLVVLCLNISLLYLYFPTDTSTFLREYIVLATAYEDSAFSHWEESQPWKTYLDSLNLNKDHQNILNDPDYCEKVKEYQRATKLSFDSRGLPLKKSKVVYSDYSPGLLVKKILKNYTTPVLLNHFGGMSKGKTPYDNLPQSVNMFFELQPSWHIYHQIGVNFLCEGQIYNHIPGNSWLNYKDVTANTMRDYSKYYVGREHCFDPWKVMPYTLDMTDKKQCKEFLEILRSQNTFEGINWMLKLGGNIHNGKGVSPVDQDLASKLLNKTCPFKYDYLAQRYIKNPMLIHNRKFDFRTYLVIANMDPLIVLYHDGFIRMSMSEYDPHSGDRSTHLTNLKVAQKTMDTRNLTKSEQEMLLKDQSWSYTHLHNYLMNLGLVGEDWLDTYLRKKLKENMFHIVRMNLDKLMKHPQVFELFGLDFLLDTDLNLWYIEANLTPSISGTSDEKRELNTKLITDLIDLEYALMYNGDFDEILKGTNYEVIFDGRKKGLDRYSGVIEKRCL
uniref:Uncharacterized protein n=1 Tax=Fabrea salina TaxID=342563 RepID=A0A7S3I8V1_9CILI|mmetsp:Transcript_1372/g.2191  ORF Transcript_1372/g.2191 Transcript_1372/m.2191 type:complete len:509 (+) Transcript_1372:238-1764(+)